MCRFRCRLVQSWNWIIVSFTDPTNSDRIYFSSLLEPSLGCIVIIEDTCVSTCHLLWSSVFNVCLLYLDLESVNKEVLLTLSMEALQHLVGFKLK